MMRLIHLNIELFRHILFSLICVMAVFIIMIPSAPAANENITLSSQTSGQASNTKTGISLDMTDVDINVLIKTISELTGKNFVPDNNVRGKVTIISPTRISIDEAYQVFESVLEMNGFAMVPSGQIIKIVPFAEGRSKNIDTEVVTNADNKKKAEDKLVTRLIPLTYADVKEIKTLFTPLVSKNSVILAYSDTNTLIVTDVNSNIQRLLQILEVIDVPGIGKEVSVIPLEHADATTMVKNLSSVLTAANTAQKGTTDRTLRFVADERTNSVIFIASEDDTIRIKKLITILDQDTPKGKGNIRVYQLEHALAEDMATVLQDLPKGKSGSEGGKEGVFVSEQINITADKATNSLIIMADSDDFPVFEEILQKLDIPRAMVYIEALLMEVKVDKTFDLGVEWSVFGDTEIDGREGVVGGSFGAYSDSSTTGLNITDLTTPNGLAIGAAAGAVELTTTLGTITVPNLGALIKAVETDADVHILSTPKLTTLDNEEASIIVGREVPYQTTATTSDNNTWNSYEYQDVGMTLKITPHISKDRMVRLNILMELKALLGTASEESVDRPTTSKRTVETTVIVKDQSMLVIGGLIDDNIANSVKMVPGLGRIPILGRLFRSTSKTNDKTNLYLFITPRVIQSASESLELLNDTQDKMTSIEAGLVKMYSPDAADDDIESVDTETPLQ